MPTRIKRASSILAIVAIALHGLLLGLAPLAAAADPFQTICHSSAAASDAQAPGPADAALHGCEHCNLCGAAAAPPARHEVVAGRLAPAPLLEVLRPVTVIAVLHPAAVSPKLAQGPPRFA